MMEYTGKKLQLLKQLQGLTPDISKIPETHSELIRQEEARKQYDELLKQYLAEPLILNGNVQTNIEYTVYFGNDKAVFKHGQKSTYSESGIIATIEYDENNMPKQLSYITQDYFLHNAPLKVVIPIQPPKENIIVKTEVIEREKIIKIPAEEKKTVVPIFRCKRCGKDLSEELKAPTATCRNCGLSLFEALGYEILDEKQSKKRKWF
jgi:DNA-directed RNA polymerase subunit RPC12/RpoP